MKVILTKDLAKYGKAGDIVEMNDNFARKCVIANGLGLEATPVNLNNLKLKLKHEAKVEAETLENAKDIKTLLSDKVLVIKVKTGKDNKMFGYVTYKEIANAIKEQFNITVDRKLISGGVLNKVGETSVNIKLHKEVKVELKVNIISEQ